MAFLENKIPPPLVALIFAVAMLCLSFYTPKIAVSVSMQLVLVVLLFLLGAVFSVSGVVSFRKAKTTVNPLKPESSTSLVISGVYTITRNPMYVGFVLFLLAWSAYLASLWAVGFALLYAVYIQRFQILPEERAMESLFGQAFIDYKSRVRRWL